MSDPLINSIHASPFARAFVKLAVEFARERARDYVTVTPVSDADEIVATVLGEIADVVAAAWNRAHEEIVATTISSGPSVVETRRAPRAGEVLPPEQRASWAREKTEHDEPAPTRFVPHPNCPSPSGRKA